MGHLDRFWELPSEQPFRGEATEPSEGVVRFPSTPPSSATRGSEAALELVHQAVEVITGIENHANETAKRARSIAEKAIQRLRFAEERVEELEAQLQAAQGCISEANAKIKDSDETLKIERTRLDVAEKKLCQIEMRARTAEAQAKENANAVLRIEEAIRNQILAKRLALNKATSAG